MDETPFDAYADQYDAWFLKNPQVLESEVALLAHSLGSPGRCVSVGCGTGLFETLLARSYGLAIKEGVEPFAGMRAIAIKRGLAVRAETAEEARLEPEAFDTVVFNGICSYLKDRRKAFENAFRALKPGGRLLVLDVPKESAYAVLYNFGKTIGHWDHPCFRGVTPAHVYPIEFVRAAEWTTTPEKVALLEATGFASFTYAQTLVRHPAYTHTGKEEPIEGYDRGSYVCIIARK